MKLSTVLRHPFAKHCWVARLGQWRWPGRGGQWTQGGQRVDTVKGRGGRKVLQVWWHTPSMTHMLKNRQFMCNYRYKNYKYCCWKGVSTVQGGRLGKGKHQSRGAGCSWLCPDTANPAPDTHCPAARWDTALLDQTAPAWVGN